MTRTDLTIINAALRRVGSNAISTRIDPSPSASICDENYPQVVREVLRMHPWGCATKRAIPVQIQVDANLYPGLTAYEYPVDCVRLIDTEGEWTTESGLLFTNSGNPVLRYVSDLIEPSRWDELLAEAVTIRLAWKLALMIANNKELAGMLAQEYAQILDRARMADGKEKKSGRKGDAMWSSIL